MEHTVIFWQMTLGHIVGWHLKMIKRKSYGRKVDVYSFGLILWEMVSGTIPYDDMTPIQAAFAVVHKNLRPAIPQDCSPAMRSFDRAMLVFATR
ncbi:protein kinase superfamily protein [Actinidia rufa]|uniref:Protein kinase superfamily protein n=1 Tax=Actinidia rufa TaxID=165716 RepID=A0A7J0EZF9_9ERIC|nr:protein kinase superfamily protein [Actinidia rufa]